MFKQPWIHVLLAICLLYLASGAANWGVFGYWLVLPLVPIFLLLIVKLRYWVHRAQWLVLMCLIVLPLAADHSRNPLLFSALSREASFSCDWIGLKFKPGYSSHSFFSLYHRDALLYRGLSGAVVERQEVPCDQKLVLDQIHFTYPEFEGWAQPVFRTDNGVAFTTDSYSFDRAIESASIVVPGLSSGYGMQSGLGVFLMDVHFSMLYWFIFGIPLSMILVILLAFAKRNAGTDNDQNSV